MADYAQTTYFAPKDALATGNPAKLIKGTEVDPELAALSLAIATKYDVDDIANNLDATDLTSDTKLISPLKLQYALTIRTETALLTLTGVTATVTGNGDFTKVGRIVQARLPLLAGTSNTAGLGLSGIPAGYQPVQAEFPVFMYNSGVLELGIAVVAGPLVTMIRTNGSPFTASGVKGFGYNYPVNLSWYV